MPTSWRTRSVASSQDWARRRMSSATFWSPDTGGPTCRRRSSSISFFRSLLQQDTFMQSCGGERSPRDAVTKNSAWRGLVATLPRSRQRLMLAALGRLAFIYFVLIIIIIIIIFWQILFCLPSHLGLLVVKETPLRSIRFQSQNARDGSAENENHIWLFLVTEIPVEINT